MSTQRISVMQAARAMYLDSENELALLLVESGITPVEGFLDEYQISSLLAFLEQKQAERVKRAKVNLDHVARRYTFLIDTCSLLHEAFPDLMTHLIPILRECGKRMLVPSGVVAELRNLGERKCELRSRVMTLANHLAALKEEDLVEICGEYGESFGDKQILSTATRLMTDTELLIITQDKGLSEDLLQLNSLRSVHGKRLSVGRINRYGYLSRYIPESSRSKIASVNTSWSISLTHKPELKEDTGEVVSVAHIPESGELVYGDGDHTYQLGVLVASGGEGHVYELEDGTVAKIYRSNRLTVSRRDKVRLMAESQFNCPGVCWPKEVLSDIAGNFLGFRMDRARGRELQRTVLTKPALERAFPSWEKKDIVQLSVTILEKICALHKHGVILGDINPLNILVSSPTDVWFVDCDSYQFNGYPCPVGTVRFTAPEIQKRNFATFLRTEGNENFAVATLLFMLMLPGKSPYAQQGSDNQAESIIAMDFPYPCGDRKSDGMPEGSWRFLWSHLPRYIKEYFYETFQRNGKYSTEKTRLNAEKWLFAFRYYLDLLNSGKLQQQDPESRKIFPSRWKVTDADARRVMRTCTCIECGDVFDITVGERDFYEKHGLALPLRCPTCRKLRKLSSGSDSTVS